MLDHLYVISAAARARLGLSLTAARVLIAGVSAGPPPHQRCAQVLPSPCSTRSPISISRRACEACRCRAISARPSALARRRARPAISSAMRWCTVEFRKPPRRREHAGSGPQALGQRSRSAPPCAQPASPHARMSATPDPGSSSHHERERSERPERPERSERLADQTPRFRRRTWRTSLDAAGIRIRIGIEEPEPVRIPNPNPGSRRRSSSPRGCYLQQRLEGVPGSVVFVAAGGRAAPLGVSRQLVGEPAFGASGFSIAATSSRFRRHALPGGRTNRARGVRPGCCNCRRV